MHCQAIRYIMGSYASKFIDPTEQTVSIIRKYHIHRLQTNPWHHEKETVNRQTHARTHAHTHTHTHTHTPGRVAQSVTCLATDACLTADPG